MAIGKDISDQSVPELLRGRGLFQKMCSQHCEWLALPVSSLPTLTSMPTCKDVLPIAVATASTELENAWLEKHCGYEHVGKNQRVGPVRYNACRFGACVCQPGFHWIVLSRMQSYVRQCAEQHLTGGDIFLCWKSFYIDSVFHGSGKGAEVLDTTTCHANATVGHGVMSCTLWVHVCITQLRPFRMTFIEVAAAAHTVCEHAVEIRKLFHSRSTTAKVLTMYEFVVKRLDPLKAWDLSAFLLINDDSAVPKLSGSVLAQACVQEQRIWAGGMELRRTRAKKKKAAYEVLSTTSDGHGDASTDFPSSVGQESGALAGNLSEDDTVEEDPLNSNTTSDSLEHLVTLAAELASGPELEEAQPRQRNTEGANRTSRSSSSSSSSTSSTDSTPERPSGAVSQAAAATDSEPPPVARTVQDSSHVWGNFRLTYRPPSGGLKAAWQGTCRFHADFTGDKIRTRCTRTCAIEGDNPRTAESQAKLRAVKSWLVLAHTCRSKATHQKFQCTVLDDTALQQALLEMPAPPETPWRGNEAANQVGACDCHSCMKCSSASEVREDKQKALCLALSGFGGVVS